MKKKYAGPQVSATTDVAQGVQSVAALEKAIQAQGDKVRQLKATTKDKAVLQPEINILLDLKKQLTEAQSKQNAVSTASTQNGSSVKDLEAAVQAQGDKVRQLKAQTKDKAVWQPEVNILLDLKKQLAAAQTTPSPQNTTAPTPANANQVKELEDKIAKQVKLNITK